MRNDAREILRLLVVLATVWLVLVFCTGCAARETNKATQQADQAVEASGRILADRVAPHVAQLPPEIQAEVRAAMDHVCALLTSARTSLRPALALTAGNEPPQPVDTTVEEAVERPQQFIAKAAIQAGRAAVEVENIGWWLSVGVIVLQYGQAIGGSIASQLLLLTGGAGGVAAIVAKGVQVYRKLKTATTDAVAFGNDAAKAMTPEALKEVVDVHERRQLANGTKAVLKQAGAAIKRPSIELVT